MENAHAANDPHLKLLKELNISCATVVKAEENKSLFAWVKDFYWGAGKEEGCQGNRHSLMKKVFQKPWNEYCLICVSISLIHIKMIFNIIKYH